MKKTVINRNGIAYFLMLLMVVLAACENDSRTDSGDIIKVGDRCPRFQVTDFNLVAHDMPDKEKPSLIFFSAQIAAIARNNFPLSKNCLTNMAMTYILSVYRDVSHPL